MSEHPKTPPRSIVHMRSAGGDPRPVLPSIWKADKPPRSTERFVFLAVAIEKVARMMSPTDWTASEEQKNVGADPIIGACIDGTLQSFLRPMRGGELTELGSAAWLSVNEQSVIDSCAMLDGRGGAGWIYLDGAGFAELLKRVGEVKLTAKPPATPTNNISAKDISKTKWVKRDDVEACARQRLELEGVLNPPEPVLRHEFRKMLKEQGFEMSQGSIDDARRKHGKHVIK